MRHLRRLGRLGRLGRLSSKGKEMKKEENSVFRGEFSDEICDELHTKRRECGLSYAQLGKLLQVSWVTVRNWEKGKIGKCHPSKVLAVRHFLSGRMDVLWNRNRSHYAEWEKGERDERKLEMLNKISKTYELCSQSNELRKLLITEIMRLSREAIASFAEQSVSNEG